MPALFKKSGPHRRKRVIRTFRSQSEAPRRPPRHLNFADGYIEMPALITWGGADVRAIDHDGHLVVRGWFVFRTLRCFGLNFRRSAVCPVADGGVICRRAREQHGK
jgi:hypothetical protein